MNEFATSEEICVLLPAAKIPTGATVTKRNGEKRYRLVDEIMVYREDGTRQPIEPEAGARFMVNGDRIHINAVSGETKLLWHTNTHELLRYLEERR